MANLAIKGNASRGKEVIRLLEMLGGKNRNHCCGEFINRIYFINENGYIESTDDSIAKTRCISFTLEEFNEKFPYKVGDKVITEDNTIGEILKIEWDGQEVFYSVIDSHMYICTYQISELQFYKEENMKDKEYKIKIPQGYKFSSIDYNNDEVVVILEKIKMPINYKECCDILGLATGDSIDTLEGYEKELLESLQILLICRNAYWKIAGQELGLETSWEPIYTNNDENELYTISMVDGEILKSTTTHRHALLVFPTKKMRDTFYNNFKIIIAKCSTLI